MLTTRLAAATHVVQVDEHSKDPLATAGEERGALRVVQLWPVAVGLIALAVVVAGAAAPDSEPEFDSTGGATRADTRLPDIRFGT